MDEITEWPLASEARRREILRGLEQRAPAALTQDPALTARD
jgi:predicted Fe-S protein YdhL (DUF1289 family)